MSAAATTMPPLDARKLVFQGTASHRGRQISVSPANSLLERLWYGRILLGPDTPRASFSTEGRETSLIVMRGACALTVDGVRHDLGLHDGAYIPRGKTIEISAEVDTDIVENGAEVDGDYPLQIIRYSDVSANPKLEVHGRRRGHQPRPQHRHRRQREGGTADGRLHALAARALDQLAAARAHRAGRGAVRLLRHAAARVRHSAGLHPPRGARAGGDRARRRRGADARRLSPQRGGARARHQLHLDDGRAARRRSTACSAWSTSSRASTKRAPASRRARSSGWSPMATDAFRLDGLRALVTGAGTGIGRRPGRRAGRGRRRRRLPRQPRTRRRETAARITALGARGRRRSRATWPRRRPPTQLVEQTAAALGGIDILVNNAGIIRRAPAAESTDEDWDAVLDVNLTARLTACAGPPARRMLAQRPRQDRQHRVAARRSRAASRVPAYAARKGARRPADQGAGQRMGGPRRQRQRDRARLHRHRQHRGAARRTQTRNRQILERIPAGRWGEPSDLGGAAVFLASRAQRLRHGHVLVGRRRLDGSLSRSGPVDHDRRVTAGRCGRRDSRGVRGVGRVILVGTASA